MPVFVRGLDEECERELECEREIQSEVGVQPQRQQPHELTAWDFDALLRNVSASTFSPTQIPGAHVVPLSEALAGRCAPRCETSTGTARASS